jgi:hypothetical protein
MTQPIVVFDLDGTLIDTAPDLLASLNHCLSTEEMDPVEAAELRRYVGMGARVMIQRAFGAGQRELDDATLSRLMDVFLDHYTSGMPGQSAPYPGLLQTLDRLQDAGYVISRPVRPRAERARSSAGEHSLHTRRVTGSIPVAPTIDPRSRRSGSQFPIISTISTRRLRARPSSVRLLATGDTIPAPAGCRRPRSMPWPFASASTTDWARRWDRSRL